MLLITRVYYRMLSIQLMSIKLIASKILSEFVYCMTKRISIPNPNFYALEIKFQVYALE